MHPFFSPDKRKASHRNMDSATSLDVAADKANVATIDSARDQEQSRLSRFASANENAQSNVTITSVHVDPELMAKRNEQQDVLDQLGKEKLPGPVKTKWALNYKLGMDKAIEDALDVKEIKAEKVKTKGRFQIEAKTNAGAWMVDRKWTFLANPDYQAHEKNREELDLKLLVKRQKQKAIQNMALEQQYKITVKLPKR